MASSWSRRLAGRARGLRGLLRDTQRALHDVGEILRLDPELSTAVQEVAALSSKPTVLVLLGSTRARARLLHCLLGRKLLPDVMPRGCRWIRVQFGVTTQVHLTLGNSEFELVEELVCNKTTWETLPVEDIIRRDQTDISTVLEVELNHPFLKDGLRIMIPPDLDVDPGSKTLHQLKQLHSDFYSKRGLILKGYNPVYLFAMDKIGQNVFSENCVPNCIGKSRSEEDFWSTYNLYYMTRSTESSVENGQDGGTRDAEKKVIWRSKGDAVITPESCLDLYQAKELNPHAQLLFVLLTSSGDVTAIDKRGESAAIDETESTEYEYSVEELPESDQGLVQSGMRVTQRSSLWQPPRAITRLNEAHTSFMNELLDQWEIMSSPPPKHYAKSQTLIIDDIELLRTADITLAPFLSNAIQNANERERGKKDEEMEGGVVKSRTALLNSVVQFATDCFQGYLLECCLKLSEVHVKLLQHFILASFDMARELQIVPKKIQYVARQEQQLYETINEKFTEGEKKQELLKIMEEVLKEIREEVNNMDWSVDDLPWHQDHQFVISNSTFYSSRDQLPADSSASDGEEAMSYDSYNFDDYDIIDGSSCSGSFVNVGKRTAWWAASQAASIRVETECSSSQDTPQCSAQCEGTPCKCGAIYCPAQCAASPAADTGRCEASAWSSGIGSCTGPSLSVKQATVDVQQTVLTNLSRKISLKLVKFVDCLKDSYFGTMQRCVEGLELRCGADPPCCSAAVQQLAAAARTVTLTHAPASLLRTLLHKLRALVLRLRLPGGAPEPECCALSPRWRRRVALRTAHSLTPARLARLISTQILEKLSVAHERFQAALTSLESVLNNRLHQTEDVKLAIRKKYAPSFARLCLESTSMCDVLMYGTPKLGKEIGRGQYGVVYAAKGEWGGHSPLAIKSVLPADERHYQELAMEFFYTRSIPRHPRIVPLLGSVVQRHGGGGPCVLLVSERRTRDLHAAIRAGLSFQDRMRVSCDIVEGIRYLHSFGLVHRDIKMKNVLLDAENRAALADLGFCTAGALVSGSLVGTPVHMAPELLSPPYDAAVDIYAFGILFWYVCAGNIKLPSAFEMFQNKEQLWSKVKRGLRPERLEHFSDECWEIMESCWASEPSQRARLGDIQPKLEKILEDARNAENNYTVPFTQNDTDDVSDDDSPNMTGGEWN